MENLTLLNLEKSISIAKILTQLGYNVAIIDEKEVFVTVNWEPTEKMSFTSLIGKDVTQLGAKYLLGAISANADLSRIVNEINSMPTVRRQYSHHYKYIFCFAVQEKLT